jgi:hypothetical protein
MAEDTLPTPEEAQTKFSKGLNYAIWCLYTLTYNGTGANPAMRELLLPLFNWLVGAGTLILSKSEQVAYGTGVIYAMVCRAKNPAEVQTFDIPFDFPAQWDASKALFVSVIVRANGVHVTAMNVVLVTSQGDNVTVDVTPPLDDAWHTIFVQLLPAANGVNGKSGILTLNIQADNNGIGYYSTPKLIAQ